MMVTKNMSSLGGQWKDRIEINGQKQRDKNLDNTHVRADTMDSKGQESISKKDFKLCLQKMRCSGWNQNAFALLRPQECQWKVFTSRKSGCVPTRSSSNFKNPRLSSMLENGAIFSRMSDILQCLCTRYFAKPGHLWRIFVKSEVCELWKPPFCSDRPVNSDSSFFFAITYWLFAVLNMPKSEPHCSTLCQTSRRGHLFLPSLTQGHKYTYCLISFRWRVPAASQGWSKSGQCLFCYSESSAKPVVKHYSCPPHQLACTVWKLFYILSKQIKFKTVRIFL